MLDRTTEGLSCSRADNVSNDCGREMHGFSRIVDYITNFILLLVEDECQTMLSEYLGGTLRKKQSGAQNCAPVIIS